MQPVGGGPGGAASDPIDRLRVEPHDAGMEISTPSSGEPRRPPVAARRGGHRSPRPIPQLSLAHLEVGPVPTTWNETELTDAIVTVCDENPSAPMVACWRVLDHCRRSTPHGSPESLRAAMRVKLRSDLGPSVRATGAAA